MTSSSLASARTTVATARLRIAAGALEARAALRKGIPRFPRRSPRHGAPVGDRRADRPRVLFVSPHSIVPPNSGGAMRHWNLIRRLAPEFDLHLAIFGTLRDNPVEREALSAHCRSLHYLQREDAPPPRPWSLLPRSAEFFAFDRARRRLRDLARELDVDLVQLEHAETGQFHDLFPGRAVALTELDLTFESVRGRQKRGFEERYETDRVLWSSRLDRLRQLRYEVLVCNRVDEVHVMSALDAERLARYLRDGDRRIRVVPNGVDCAEFRPPAAPSAPRWDVLFVGSFGHTPNLDAVEWLLGEIWPRIRAIRPDARLGLVGSHPTPGVLARHGRDGIEVVGTVRDIAACYRAARVLVAPIRAGSGTRLKLLEAFASGVPVVATRMAAEGLATDPLRYYLEAESPEEMAQAVGSLLDDPQLGGRLVADARRLALERYDWDRSAETLAGRWRALIGPGRRRASVGGGAERAPPGEVAVSIVIPTKNGGERLALTLQGIERQVADFRFEVLCVDSGSRPEELEWLGEHATRVVSLPPGEFNHGTTRDLGASLARGRVLVFLNQDAIPADDLWLHNLATPLLHPGPYDAVQGGIREDPRLADLFYWHSGGPRFYFTSESVRWIASHGGIGFSTINAAIRRTAWLQRPFGWAPILEDKKWQAALLESGGRILDRQIAAVLHSHGYGLRSLWRRCRSEGYGWRTLGERYTLRLMVDDLRNDETWSLWREGVRSRRVRTAAELLFPLVRPLAIYAGNRWAKRTSN